MGADSVDWEVDLDSFSFGSVHDFLKGVGIFRHMNLSFSEFVSSELFQKGVAHSSYDDDLIGDVEHVEDEIDFIGDFESSEDDQHWFLGVVQEVSEII